MCTRLTKELALIALLFCMFIAGAHAQSRQFEDEIILASGKVIRGFILEKTEDQLIVRVGRAKLAIALSEVREIVESPTSSREEKQGDIEFSEQRFEQATLIYRRALTRTKDATALARIHAKIEQCKLETQKLFLAQFEKKRREAMALGEEGQFAQARQVLEEILTAPGGNEVLAQEIKADIARILCLRAKQSINHINFPAALVQLDEAIAIAPHYYESLLLKADILFEANELTSDTAQLFARGLELCKDQKSPLEQSDIHQKAGDIYKLNNMPKLAVKHYHAAINLGARELKVFVQLAETYESMAGDLSEQDEKTIEESIVGLKMAIAMNPLRMKSREVLGRAYLELERYDEAIDVFQQAAQIQQKAQGINLLLGRAYFGKGEVEKAEAALREEIKINPNSYEAYIRMGEINLRWKKFDVAVSDCRKALGMAPNNLQAIQVIAEAYYRSEEYDKAKEWNKKILDQQKDDLDALLRLAQIELQQDHYSEAQAEFLKIRKQLAENHGTFMEDKENLLRDLTREELRVFAQCLTSEGTILLLGADRSPRAAKANHELALEYDPNSARAYTNLGISYRELDQYDEAKEALAKARGLEPLNPDAWLELGRLYNELQESKEAIVNFKRYIELSGRDWELVRDWLIDLGVPESEIPESPLLTAGKIDKG